LVCNFSLQYLHCMFSKSEIHGTFFFFEKQYTELSDRYTSSYSVIGPGHWSMVPKAQSHTMCWSFSFSFLHPRPPFFFEMNWAVEAPYIAD
jgi:hypothetical protein